MGSIEKPLKNKRAVVFGGSGGIGTQLCEHLMDNGVSKLAVLDLNLCEINRRPNVQLVWKQCNITDRNQMERVLRQEVLPEFGHIDIFVNSAGILYEDNPNRTMSINLVGVISSSHLAMQLMARELGGGGGIIVNIASISGLEPTPYMSVYTASKFGVVGFTRSMANDVIYNRTGIKFITICPGATDTPLLSSYFAAEHMTFPWMRDAILEVREEQQRQAQSPTVVGECLVKALADGDNGAVWISANGENYKLRMPPNQFFNRS